MRFWSFLGMLRRLYTYTCTLQIFLHRQSVQDTQSTVKPLSRVANPSKNELKRSIAFCTSCEPAVSLIECMDSIALPTSTVRIPIFDNMGPTVDPQGLGRWMRFCCYRNKKRSRLTCHSELQTPGLSRPSVPRAASRQTM